MSLMRTHLFFKVEVEHDDAENPQRLAGEIQRQLMKLYAVRDVELASVTRMED